MSGSIREKVWYRERSISQKYKSDLRVLRPMEAFFEE